MNCVLDPLISKCENNRRFPEQQKIMVTSPLNVLPIGDRLCSTGISDLSTAVTAAAVSIFKFIILLFTLTFTIQDLKISMTVLVVTMSSHWSPR